jgi:DNA-binding protein HU-beta
LLENPLTTTSKEEQVNKPEFIDAVAAEAGLSKKDAGDAVDAFISVVESTLKSGGEVTFTGFGKFSVTHTAARQGRNPATGATIQIPAGKRPKFSAGAALKKAVK